MRKTLVFTTILIFAASTPSYSLVPCTLKTVKIAGEPNKDAFHGGDYLATVYDPVPCVWTLNTPMPSYGTIALTSLDSSPQGADIVIDEKIIGKTPATLVLERTNTQKRFAVVFRKAGFKDAVGDITSGRGGKMPLVPEDASKELPPEDLSKGDDLPPIVQRRCGDKAWINAFAPGDSVHSQDSLCPADRSRALFTREGTLACPSAETLDRLINTAMEYSWFIAPTRAEAASWLAGDHSPENTGQTKYLNSLGCTVYHDGTAVKIHEEDRGMANTNIGWVPEANLRN
jgi:hypothetical protein